MPRQNNVNLAAQREAVRQAWDASQDEYVALRTAAGLVFHEVYEDMVTEVVFDDYEDALDIVAAALSRLMPIYADAGQRMQPAALTVDLSRQRFRNGATELTARDGAVLGQLLVTRSSVSTAIFAIKRADLPFRFAQLRMP